MVRIKIVCYFFLLVTVNASVLWSGCEDDEDTYSDTDSNGCPDEQGSFDENTSLCWQHPREDLIFITDEVVDYCENLSLGGHDDWYPPSRQDFIDLLGGCDSDVWSGDYGPCNTCVVIQMEVGSVVYV